MNIFCTLFNSNYLDRGLLLYKSLVNILENFTVYILAMDDECYNVLLNKELEHARIIKLSQFENDELLKVKYNRSFAEYCWTCTPFLIKYVLNKYEEMICTYIDADTYFYNNPALIFKEMRKMNKTVVIVPHNFPQDKKYAKNCKLLGTYCVEFNTFVNERRALLVLKSWCEDCLRSCALNNETWGDQKYLEKWATNDCVCVLENRGAGLGPWNIMSYNDAQVEETLCVYSKEVNKTLPLIFYHFESIKIFNNNLVEINVYHIFKRYDKHLIKKLYIPYLQSLINIRIELKEKYNIKFKYAETFYGRKLFNKKSIKDNLSFMLYLLNIKIGRSKNYIKIS
jgi:hypothetical protein